TRTAKAKETEEAPVAPTTASPIIRRRSKTDESGEATSQTVVMKRTGASDAEARAVTSPAAKAAALAHSVGAEPDPEPAPTPETSEESRMGAGEAGTSEA